MSNQLTTTTQNPPAVSYEQMEKMAVTCANSKLFGVKSKDEAMALMLLASAEGVHPMTAVRDFHIISGKPSLKAETMLARFLNVGGKVEWHSLTDKKAEATFAHPQGGTVKIDWTIERAQTAGLAGKDVWKAYGRAMLRSRCISEGVRTVCPGVISGTYTPEEMVMLDPDVIPATTVGQVIASVGESVVSSAQSDEWITTISESKTLEELKTVYGAAWSEAKQANDKKRADSYKLAYDARKSELIAIESCDAPPAGIELDRVVEVDVI